MNFRIPVYVYQHPQGYAARPLFATGPEERDTNLNRLLTKLTRRLVTAIEQAARGDRHDPVAEWAFSPRITTHRVALDIELRRRVARVKYLLVAFDHMGRRLAFTPALPEVWFEVTRGEPLELRAAAVFGEHWRTAEREADDEEEVRPEATNLAGKAWVQVLELSASVPAVAPKPPAAKFLFLGGADTGDGAAELRRVGRCLDWLYPDELERAVLRDREVGELSRLLELGDRRPVLLCGPRLAGKTAVVHEAVFHRVARRKRVHVQQGNVWLVSPQRLVSGMSYVGQWEGRLLAILKHAKKRDHVLYFDDLIGLFLAGVSANSTLNAATVLKPYLERRDVRVLGEVSTDGLRVLQERDRGFADLFHLIPVREPTDADNLRILVDQQRRLEGKHGCDFGLDVLPTVIDVQRRYDRTAAFPGKAAAILTRLAIRATASAEGETRRHGDTERKGNDGFSPHLLVSPLPCCLQGRRSPATTCSPTSRRAAGFRWRSSTRSSGSTGTTCATRSASRWSARPRRSRRSPTWSASPKPGSMTRTGRSRRSCSSGRRASARPSARRPSPARCSVTPKDCCGST
jgi:hypothetical protein